MQIWCSRAPEVVLSKGTLQLCCDTMLTLSFPENSELAPVQCGVPFTATLVVEKLSGSLSNANTGSVRMLKSISFNDKTLSAQLQSMLAKSVVETANFIKALYAHVHACVCLCVYAQPACMHMHAHTGACTHTCRHVPVHAHMH